LAFDEAYGLFREQVIVAESVGADLVFIETMMDLQEVRAAILAVKENSQLPIFVTMTFDAGGRTFCGHLPESFAIVATAMGVDALGINCSLGPCEMGAVLDRIAGATDLPLIVKPNAGLPNPLTGTYDLGSADFARSMEGLARLGASILGGCCGADPAYIAALGALSSELEPPGKRGRLPENAVCSASRMLILDSTQLVVKSLNPKEDAALRQALMDGDTGYMMEAVIDQAAGAEILDINMELPGLDEPALIGEMIFAVQSVTSLPVQIRSSKPEVIESGLRHYCGRAIIKIETGDRIVLERVLPLVKKYGAVIAGTGKQK